MLSGYRLMWVVVMFDLPVVERAERKAATEFRNALLDMGAPQTHFCASVITNTQLAGIDTGPTRRSAIRAMRSRDAEPNWALERSCDQDFWDCRLATSAASTRLRT